MSNPNLFLFGAPRLERDGVPIEVDTRKAIALIAYLAVTRQSHSRDALATLLWEEYDQSRARAALRRTLSVLHTALGAGQLEIERETIGLNPNASLLVDEDQFRKRLAECQTHGHSPMEVCPVCVTPLAEAAALYRDDFLAGFTLRDSPNFDEWQFFQTESLRRDLASALERLVRYHSAQKEVELAIVYARRLLGLDSLHEPAHRHLMQLYALAGQRAAALRQYQECVRILKQELGVPPLEETTQLYESIKNRKSGGAEHTSRDEIKYPLSLKLEASSFHPHYPFVGRAAELSTLIEAYTAARADGHFVILEGEAGIGKTRLAETFLAHVQAKGATTVSVRCYEGETNLAYGPFIEALRAAIAQPDRANHVMQVPPHFLSEAVRLLPELRTLRPSPSTGTAQGLPPVPPLNSPGSQSRFFEGIRQVLMAICSGAAPGVLFIDDLQWADAASLDLLTYIVQRLRGCPLFILGTWRSEQMPSRHRLRQLLTEAQRAHRATRLSLSRLSLSAVMELVQSLDAPASKEVRAQHIGPLIVHRLYRETEGLPFFLVEYLSAIVDEMQAAQKAADPSGDPAAPRGATPGGVDWSLPGGVRDLLHSRLIGVSETGRQLLSAAAVIGRSFDFDTLREASGRNEEEIVTALEEVMAQGLVREMGMSSTLAEVASSPIERGLLYDFGHEKLRALSYDETSLARRRLLHRRVAESLVTRARVRHEASTLASQIAYHYQQSGNETNAAEYFKRSGEHARSLYANAEALSHFRSALLLNHPDAAELHEAIGELQTLMGEYGAALVSYETATNLRGPQVSANLEQKRGNVHHRRGEWELAEIHFQAALTALGEEEAEKRARIYADWCLTAHQQGQTDKALALARRALELAKTASDVSALAQAHNILGILNRSQGNLDEARDRLEESLALADTLKEPGARAAALNNLALVCTDAGEIERALTLTRTALELCASQGDRHREAALHNNLADMLHAAGQSEAAMSHLKQAVAIFAEIGAEAGTLQPEIWKLVEW